MTLPSLLVYLGILLTAPSPAHAQPDPRPDTLVVAVEAPRPLPHVTDPTRRCRDAIDRQAGEWPVAQARCAGGFGLPAVTTGGRIARMDQTLRAEITAAVSEALGTPRGSGDE